MRKTIACLAALSLLVMITPTALAGHLDFQGALACGGYSYNGTSGEDRAGAETDAHPMIEGLVQDQHLHYAYHLYLPKVSSFIDAGQALAQDVQDGDTNGDNQPLEGNGYAHVTVFNERFGLQIDAGSDVTDPNWSTSCK